MPRIAVPRLIRFLMGDDHYEVDSALHLTAAVRLDHVERVDGAPSSRGDRAPPRPGAGPGP